MRLFDSNLITKTTRYFHDNGDGTYTIESQADVEDIITDAKIRDNHFRPNANWKGEMHMDARIPTSIVFELKRTGQLFDQRAMKRWLNNPDNRMFRTRPGRV